MAGLFAPEISAIGPSSLTKGLGAPDNIDYSNLFQSIVDITEPKKVSEADKKSEDRRRLNYALNSVDAIESKVERETRMRQLRRTAEGEYSSLSSEDINKQFEPFTGMTPFDEKSAQQIMNETVMKSVEEDTFMQLAFTNALAESGGDTDAVMRTLTTKWYERQAQKEQHAQLLQESEKNTISKKVLKDTLLSGFVVQTSAKAAEIKKNLEGLSKVGGMDGLTGDALFTSLIPQAEKMVQDYRSAVRADAAKVGVVLTKEEEDIAVSEVNDILINIKTMSEDKKNILTAKQVQENLQYIDKFPIQFRDYLKTPDGQAYLAEVNGGRAAIAEVAADLAKNGFGIGSPSAKADPNATYNPGVEGPDDSPTTVQKRIPFYSVESVVNGMKHTESDKVKVLALVKADMNSPERLQYYSQGSVNKTLNNFVYGYLFFDNALDPQGNTLTKKVIDNMYGGQAIVFAEALAKKSPENAPDMYNKMVNMSAITADRMIAKVKANLDIINRTAMQDPLPNPFVFKADPNGNITGSFNPQTVSKNPYIQKSLTKYGVFGDKPYTQETFWAVMRDYTSAFDKYPIISGDEFNNVKDGIDSLQTLAKFSLKIPGASEKPNAHSTILARIPSLFSGTEQSLEEMAPAEIRRRAAELEVPPRARIVQGNRP